MAYFQEFVMLFGGLGVFMLAVSIISDGLRLSAGHALRKVLSKWTDTPLRGMLSGAFITGLVQSSSAVTVATIGFVNSGLMTLKQSLGVVFGANVGTTMTGWLVAMIGFKLKIDLFALPLIGMGMFLHIFAGGRRLAHIGWALVGFGLFFVGIDVLRTSFEGLANGFNFEQLSSQGIGGALAYVGIGFLMTVLTQSSSAAMAIILTAAAGNVVTLNDAALLVIGANLGTTSTAILAVIGSTSNAKRVAAAHVLFNLITAIVAVLILPILLWLVGQLSSLLNLNETPEVVLALFHTIFNVLGVLLVWPMMSRMAAFLGKRFISPHEKASKPIFIDKNVAVSPSIAVIALNKELQRLSNMLQGLLREALRFENKNPTDMVGQYKVIDHLSTQTAEFITRIEKQELTNELTSEIQTLILSQQYCVSCAELALKVSAEFEEMIDELSPNPLSDFQHYIKTTRRLINAVSAIGEGEDDEAFFLNSLAEAKEAYEIMKTMCLRYSTSSMLTIQQSMALMELIKTVRQMTEQYTKAKAQLHKIGTHIQA
jgi:phosphate:Na+ symporter